MPRLSRFKWDEWARWTKEQIENDSPAVVAVDTETSGVAFYDMPFAATLTWRGKDGALRNGYFELEGDDDRIRLEALTQSLLSVPTWIMHNAKFDLQKLLLVGAITWYDFGYARVHDTATIYHLLDENGRKGLKHLAVTQLGWDDTIQVEVKSGPNKGTFKSVPREEHKLAEVRRKLKLKKEDGYHLLPRDVLIPYALRDTDFTLQLFELLKPKLDAKDAELQALYEREMKLKIVLLRMEAAGLALDLDYLKCIASEYGVKVMEGMQRVAEISGNPELNPASPAQLQAAFKARGVHLDSTNEATLRDTDDELAQAILAYRSDKKIHTTYLQALLNEHRGGITHPNFNPDGTRTGRMSSSSARA